MARIIPTYCPDDAPPEEKAGHATIGTRNLSVVVTGLNETMTSGKFNSLFYAGLTRTTNRLAALIKTSTFRHTAGGTT